MIKVLFVVLLLSTAAMVAVGIAFFLRVRRHLDGTEAETRAAPEAPGQDKPTIPLTGAAEEIDHGQSSDEDRGQSG